MPYIPFGEYESSGYTIGNRLIRVHGIPINVDVVPLNRNNKQIGTIAILRHFAEEEARQNKIRIQLLEKGHKAKYIFNDIVGESPAIRKVKDIAQKMARTKSSILITGESGTGKELFAHAIHNASDRRDRPFIAINCAALPESLLESELFGYVDGAFTGAKKVERWDCLSLPTREPFSGRGGGHEPHAADQAAARPAGARGHAGG